MLRTTLLASNKSIHRLCFSLYGDPPPPKKNMFWKASRLSTSRVADFGINSVFFFLQLDLNEDYQDWSSLLCHVCLKRMCGGGLDAQCTDSKGPYWYHWPINYLMQIIIEYAVCARKFESKKGGVRNISVRKIKWDVTQASFLYGGPCGRTLEPIPSRAVHTISSSRLCGWVRFHQPLSSPQRNCSCQSVIRLGFLWVNGALTS